jgi:hypothetical protein
MRQDAQGFPLVMLFLQTAQKLLALRIIPQKQGGGFGKSPLEVRIAAFLREQISVCSETRDRLRDVAERGASGLAAADVHALTGALDDRRVLLAIGDLQASLNDVSGFRRDRKPVVGG